METNIKYTHSIVEFSELKRSTCIYISGQMSGLTDLGEKELNAAEAMLLKEGFVSVLNPFKMVDQTKSPKWHDCMKIDLKDILNYGVGGCVLLDNWINSKGATLEVILFLALGIPLFDIEGNNITLITYVGMGGDFLREMFEKMVETHMIRE